MPSHRDFLDSLKLTDDKKQLLKQFLTRHGVPLHQELDAEVLTTLFETCLPKNKQFPKTFTDKAVVQVMLCQAGKRRSVEPAAKDSGGERQTKRRKRAPGMAFQLPRVDGVRVDDAVPEQLRACFRVPRFWLQQITPEKLHILAQVYVKTYNKAAWQAGGRAREALLEQARRLVPILEHTIKARMGDAGWEPLQPFRGTGTVDRNQLPDMRSAQRDEAVTELLANWLKGLRATGRKRHVSGLVDQSGKGKILLFMMLANPPMYLVDAFVAAAYEPAEIEMLWSLMCAQHLHVRLKGLSRHRGDLGEALAEHITEDARVSLWDFDAPRGATLVQVLIDLMHFIQTPLLLVLAELQVIEDPMYAKYIRAPPAAVDQALKPCWAMSCLLGELAAMLSMNSHLFIGLAGRSLGLAMVEDRVPRRLSWDINTRVKVLSASPVDANKTTISDAHPEGSER